MMMRALGRTLTPPLGGRARKRPCRCRSPSIDDSPFVLPAAALGKRLPHERGVVSNACWDVSALTRPLFNPSAAPLLAPKLAIACTS
jgi:hypothetical protein